MKYKLTNDDLRDIYIDTFENIESAKLKTESPFILLCSIIISILYVHVEPAKGSINDISIDLFLIYGIQLPVCLVITFLGLKFFRKLSSARAKDKLKQKLSSFLNSEDIGERELTREEGYIIFKASTFIYKFKSQYITDINERVHSYSILHGERGLFSIPKRVCSLQELKEIIVE